MAGSSHRTATTTYPCCLPALGRFSRSWSCKTCRRKDNGKSGSNLKVSHDKFSRSLCVNYMISGSWDTNHGVAVNAVIRGTRTMA